MDTKIVADTADRVKVRDEFVMVPVQDKDGNIRFERRKLTVLPDGRKSRMYA